MGDLVVRQPWVSRILAVALAGGFAVFVAVAFVLAIAHGDDVSGAPPAIAMAAVAGFIGYRLARLSFRASGQELVIRNYFRTRRVPVGQVTGLDLGRASSGSLRTVRVLTTAGIIPIDVMGVPRSLSRHRNARYQGELTGRRAELAGWLAMAQSLDQMTGGAVTS